VQQVHPSCRIGEIILVFAARATGVEVARSKSRPTNLFDDHMPMAAKLDF
jgi:hypothetical protein